MEKVKVNTNNKTLFNRGNFLALQYKSSIFASKNSVFFTMNIKTLTADKQRHTKEYSIKNNANPMNVSWFDETTKRLGRIH
jgi:hypothetical protein